MCNTKIVTFEDGVDNAYEALRAANLNFEVNESQIISQNTKLPIPHLKQLYRSDDAGHLGVVGERYQPVSNHKAFAFFDSMCKINNIAYKEAISINNGQKVILKAEYKEPVIINGDDIKRQFCLSNGFDGSVGFHATFSTLRLICTNGLRARVIDANNSFKFKHTKNISLKMEDALKVIAAGTSYFEEFIEMSNALGRKQMTTNMVDSFIDECFGESEYKKANKKRELITDLYENESGGNHGTTAWDAYNAVTEYVTHHHGNDKNRVDYANFGAGVKLSEKAFSVLSLM